MAGYREPVEDAQFYRLSEESSYLPPENPHVVSRSTVRVIPQTGTSYDSNGNRVIRIVLPSTGFLDTQNSYFLFNFANTSAPADGSSGTNSSIGLGGPYTGTAALFQRVRILVGGSVVEDVNNYNMLASMLYRCGRAGYGAAGDAAHTSYMEGYLPGTNKNAALVNKYNGGKSWQFAHKPVNGVLSNLRYLPLANVGEMTVEITLEEPQTCLFDGRNLDDIKTKKYNYTYRLDDFTYQADILQFDSEYVKGFETSMLTRGINIPFDTFTHYKSIVSSLGDVVINHRGRNVKNIWSFMRPQQAIAEAHQPSFRGYRCGLESWQLRIGAFMKPLLPVRCGPTRTVESFIEFMKTLTGFNRIDNGDIDIDATKWGSDVHKVLNATTQIGNSSDLTESQVNNPSASGTVKFDPQGYFAIGVDLEREGQIASGLDMASEATPITMSLKGGLYDTSDANETEAYQQVGTVHIDTFVHAGANLIISSPHEVTLFT